MKIKASKTKGGVPFNELPEGTPFRLKGADASVNMKTNIVRLAGFDEEYYRNCVCLATGRLLFAGPHIICVAIEGEFIEEGAE